MNNPGNNGQYGGEDGNQPRMYGAVPSAPYYGQGWPVGSGGNYPPQPPNPVPGAYYPGGGYPQPQFGYPYAPPPHSSAGGGGLYPNIGFNPALLNQRATLVKCPNAGEGCSEEIPSDCLTSHLKVCEFRSFPFCSKYFWTDCHQKVGRSALVDHLCDKHEVEETEHAKFALKLIAPSQLLHNHMTPSSVERQPGVVWDPIVIDSDRLDDHVLLRCCVSPRGYFSLAGYLLESRGNTEWKKYRIKFQLESLSKTARLEWTGRLIFPRFPDYDDETGMHPSGQFASNANLFRIPISSLIQEYIEPAKGGENSPDSSSKIKVKVCVWKHDGHGTEPPFRRCFNEEESLEKLTLYSDEQGIRGSQAFPLEEQEDYHHRHLYASPQMANSSMVATAPVVQYSREEYNNYYSPDSRCSHCHRHLFGDVIYQCLQCPSDRMVATYFCRSCIEVGNCHQDHLTMRISKPSLQPFAAVAYENSEGELH